MNQTIEVLTGLNRLVCIHAWVHIEVKTDLTSWEGSKENEPHADGKLLVVHLKLKCVISVFFFQNYLTIPV